MSRDQVIEQLAKCRDDLRDTYAVRRLCLFGSIARDEGSAKSDVDLLVEFNRKPNFDLYMNLKFFLEDLLGTKVDLVTEKAVKPRMRPLIDRESIHVA